VYNPIVALTILAVAVSVAVAATSGGSSGSGRTWVVNQASPAASDEGQGTEASPFKKISAAAQKAQPGDTVLVHAGVYRERVAPARGGEEGRPIVYQAAPGEVVEIKGSDVFQGPWQAVGGRAALGGEITAGAAVPHAGVYAAKLDEAMFATHAPAGAAQVHNPYRIQYQTKRTRSLGQVFVDGAMLAEMDTLEQVYACAGSWRTDGQSITVHFPLTGAEPGKQLVELTVRPRIFGPYTRGLGYIHVKGFRMSHCANNFCEGFYVRGVPFPQAGALGCRGGNHWLIEGNSIRFAKSIGLDIGAEGDHDADGLGQPSPRNSGYHVIRDNIISDNGGAGIVGLRTPQTRILHNLVERNNAIGYGGTESAGIKTHFLTDGVIEGNLIRDNYTQGIWLDNTWRGTRVTRNVILNNVGGALFIEMGEGSLLVDNNVLGFSRAGEGLAGDGVYSHDSSDVTFVHNLVWFNANYGLWVHVGTERRGRQGLFGANRWKVLNNIIVGNGRGEIGLPLEADGSRGNICDYNLLASNFNRVTSETWGAEMDVPLFMCNTNKGRIDIKTIRQQLLDAMNKANVPAAQRPGGELWEQLPYLTLRQWQLLTGRDTHSAYAMLLRPNLTGRNPVELSFIIDDSAQRLACPKVPGVEVDFYGKPIGAGGAAVLPGPFQSLRVEEALKDHKTYATQFRGDFEKLPQRANQLVLWLLKDPDVAALTIKAPLPAQPADFGGG